MSSKAWFQKIFCKYFVKIKCDLESQLEREAIDAIASTLFGEMSGPLSIARLTAIDHVGNQPRFVTVFGNDDPDYMHSDKDYEKPHHELMRLLD